MHVPDAAERTWVALEPAPEIAWLASGGSLGFRWKIQKLAALSFRC
jgi:hypothetical protein